MASRSSWTPAGGYVFTPLARTPLAPQAEDERLSAGAAILMANRTKIRAARSAAVDNKVCEGPNKVCEGPGTSGADEAAGTPEPLPSVPSNVQVRRWHNEEPPGPSPKWSPKGSGKGKQWGKTMSAEREAEIRKS